MRSDVKKYFSLTVLAVAAIVGIKAAFVIAQDANQPVNKPPAEDVNKPPVEAVTKPAAEMTLEQRLKTKISVEFRNTPIEDVIRIMAEQADVDIVKSPAVTGVVTVTLTDVPLEEALNNILAAHGFAYVLSENMIRVVTAEDKEKLGKTEVLLQTKTYEIVYADVKEVVKALDKFKSKQGTVTSIQGTSHIIVTDTESKIRDITAFIEQVDRMTAQILVEARIYDITSKDKLDLGIEWQVGRDTSYPTGLTAVGSNPSGDLRPFATGTFLGATAKTASTTGALRVGWLSSEFDIDALLRAQQNIIGAKLLANPRVLVLDNEMAKFDIVTEIPYQRLTEGGGAGSAPIGTTEFKEVGVKLEVTPHLAVRDEMIRLHVKPEFSIKTGEVVLIGTGAANLQYPQPVVDKRTADTMLLIKNGQTVVLGGLRKMETNKQINKVPVLGDLPLAGLLFRFKGEDMVSSELVVFITPWIIKQEPVQQAIMSPFMSQKEQEAYKVTEFPGPKPSQTGAEKLQEEQQDDDTCTD